MDLPLALGARWEDLRSGYAFPTLLPPARMAVVSGQDDCR